MKILTAQQIKALEEAEINSGISEEELMETVASNMAQMIQREFLSSFGENFASSYSILVGKGHNGGDGLVLARCLAQAGAHVVVNLIFPIEQLAALPKQKLHALEKFDGPGHITIVYDSKNIFWPSSSGVVVDAILGTGSTGSLRDPISHVVKELNDRKAQNFFHVVAVDSPTGLYATDESSLPKSCVEADLTITAGFPKDILVREEYSQWVGRIEVAQLFDASPEGDFDELITAEDLKPLARFRSPHSHKYDFGRVLIIGGSHGMSGAPVLAAHAALRAGAGLVQIATHSDVVGQVASRAWPEVMIESLENPSAIEQALEKASVVVIGPGLGKSDFSRNLLAEVLVLTPVPVIIDADALTLLSKNLKFLETCLQPLILTPHPGEMRRLLGDISFDEKERPQIASRFADEYQCTLILKGSRTVIAAPGQPRYYNSTGNPGMATGGSGDSLCGILASLLARGLSPLEASRFGVWWHGKAADFAARQRGCFEGMLPQDVIEWLAPALLSLRQAD